MARARILGARSAQPLGGSWQFAPLAGNVLHHKQSLHNRIMALAALRLQVGVAEIRAAAPELLLSPRALHDGFATQQVIAARIEFNEAKREDTRIRFALAHDRPPFQDVIADWDQLMLAVKGASRHALQQRLAVTTVDIDAPDAIVVALVRTANQIIA
jgi:hypothetical protein